MSSISSNNSNYSKVFSCLSEEVTKVVQQKIETLQPTEGELKALKEYDFKSPVFKDPSWILKAVRFLEDEKLTDFEYATLMLYNDCRSNFHWIISSIPDMPLSILKDDLAFAFEKLKFPKEKVAAFITSLQFDQDDADFIFVVANRPNHPLVQQFEKLLPLGQKNAFYVLAPQTMKKFMKHMSEGQTEDANYSNTYFRNVAFQVRHIPTNSENNLDVAIPYDAEVLGVESQQQQKRFDGFSMYLYDLHYRILSIQCRIPISHINFYKKIAEYVPSPDSKREFQRMTFPYYNPLCRAAGTPTGMRLLVETLNTKLPNIEKRAVREALKDDGTLIEGIKTAQLV